MSKIKCTYSVEEAAKFLNIIEEHLTQFTKQGNIRLWRYLGNNYYLGGELDAVKSGLLFSAQKPKLPVDKSTNPRTIPCHLDS